MTSAHFPVLDRIGCDARKDYVFDLERRNLSPRNPVVEQMSPIPPLVPWTSDETFLAGIPEVPFPAGYSIEMTMKNLS
jgi:hypothetical protein